MNYVVKGIGLLLLSIIILFWLYEVAKAVVYGASKAWYKAKREEQESGDKKSETEECPQKQNGRSD